MICEFVCVGAGLAGLRPVTGEGAPAGERRGGGCSRTCRRGRWLRRSVPIFSRYFREMTTFSALSSRRWRSGYRQVTCTRQVDVAGSIGVASPATNTTRLFFFPLNTAKVIFTKVKQHNWRRALSGATGLLTSSPFTSCYSLSNYYVLYVCMYVCH